MIPLLAAAAAATWHPPEPVYRDSWISPAIDFPRRGVSGLVVIASEITVDQRGNQTDCRANVVIGNPRMGPYTCKLIMNRAVFKPARDATGTKSYGVYRMRVAWWMGEGPPPKDFPVADFKVAAAALPSGSKEPVLRSIKFAVDAAGRITSCAAEKEDISAELSMSACNRLGTSLRVEAARDRKGRPVPSIQNAGVHFFAAGRQQVR